MLCGGRSFEMEVQVQRNKNGGCVDMSVLRMMAGFFAATALGLFLILYLDVSTTPCGDHQTEVRISDSLYSLPAEITGFRSPSAGLKSADHNGTCPAACSSNNNGTSSSPTVEVQEIREWEQPSVVDEREWEKFSDETTPEISRSFSPYGVASFLFIRFGAYRNSPSNFSIVGLSPKGLQKFGNPFYNCSWIPRNSKEEIFGEATAYTPGMKLADQYTGTVIYCVFDRDVGTDGQGGTLQLYAHMGSKDQTGLQSVELTALVEGYGEYEPSLFQEPLKYDHVYCSSPLYGNISPQRVREWMAYHAMVFGPSSHFILYDAGGLHQGVRRILAPWVKLGRVSIMNFRQEARYDCHYHSQAVAVNDCLLQAKRIGEWAFFFDLDEFLDVPSTKTLTEVMREIAEKRGMRAQQVTLNQMPMNKNHCVKRSTENNTEAVQSLWGIEELVFQRTQITEWGGWKDHKYAVQTRFTLVAGTHDHEVSMYPANPSQSLVGNIDYLPEDKLHYHHYHNTINVRADLCKSFVDPWVREAKFNNITHIYDNSMAALADQIRQFEADTVGEQPFIL